MLRRLATAVPRAAGAQRRAVPGVSWRRAAGSAVGSASCAVAAGGAVAAAAQGWGQGEWSGAGRGVGTAVAAAAAAAAASTVALCAGGGGGGGGDAGAGAGAGAGSKRLFTRAQVAEHNERGQSVWVTRGGKVYDVTQFVESHPGGPERIMLAAGAAVDPFWKIYTVHNKGEVEEILAEMCIGELDPNDTSDADAALTVDVANPFASDPKRHPALQAGSTQPFNAMPPGDLLVESFLTPNDVFFVRNHLAVPVVDPNTYRLKIERGGGIPRDVEISLQDLKTKFRTHSVTSIVQCGGNRRGDMNKEKGVKGLQWTNSAISNATWTGVRLRDVLKYAGLRARTADEIEEQHGVKHMVMEGLDGDATQHYAASVTIDKALSTEGDVLLAFEMNGEPIPRDHGFPVRMIIPGVVGARNVKWLSKITLSPTECQGHWQQKDYKSFSPNIDWNNIDWSSAPSIQEMPVNSAICIPTRDAAVDAEDDDEIEVKGYAWSGGGRNIIRVDVSLDGGETWHVATLKDGKDQRRNRAWAWTLWEFTIPPELHRGKTNIELVCKAVDSSYNAQPDNMAGIWNMRGLLANAWHRVPITLQRG